MKRSTRRPAVGTKVMYIYGRKDYAEYGEIGVVTEHTSGGFLVEMDDDQPFHREAFGSKSKRTGHTRTVEFEGDDVRPLAQVYRNTAKRFRAVAKEWDAAASRVKEALDD